MDLAPDSFVLRGSQAFASSTSKLRDESSQDVHYAGTMVYVSAIVGFILFMVLIGVLIKKTI